MKRALLGCTAILTPLLLVGCSWFSAEPPPLAWRDHYVRQEIPLSLTDPVPHPPVPPRPVTESQTLERDAAYGKALDLCNLQKGEIRRLADAPPLPSDDQKAK